MAEERKEEQKVMPYLHMKDCRKAHEWYVENMGAKILEKINPPQKEEKEKDERIFHSKVSFPNGGYVFMSDVSASPNNIFFTPYPPFYRSFPNS